MAYLPAYIKGMSPSPQHRQPAGIPIGGQFAAGSNARAAVSLDSDSDVALLDRDWGSVSVQTGSRTPWGQAQYANHPAPGIVTVGCSQHGGIKLSPERNAEIPPALRNRSGWYEEDCESAIVGLYHPDAFPHYLGGDHDAIRADMERTVKDYFPDQYEKATGETLTPDESSVLRDRQKAATAEAFRAEHANEFVTLHRGDDDNGAWVPEGYRPMTARIDATGETREFLVPYDECVENGSFVSNRLIDPHRHIDVTGIGKLGNPPPKVSGPKLTGDQLGIDYSGLTTRQRNQAADELHKRFRFRDDNGTETIESYQDHLARVGVVGKRQLDDGYYVEYGDSRVSKINVSTFAALTRVPDTATDEERASIAYRKAYKSAEAAQQRAREYHAPHERQGYIDRAAAARTRLTEARAAYDAAQEARKATEVPWEGRQQMRKDALAQLLAEKGIEL